MAGNNTMSKEVGPLLDGAFDRAAGGQADAACVGQDNRPFRKYKEMRSLLAEKSLNLIAVSSSDWMIRYVSPAIRKLLGFTAEEVVGRKHTDLLHPDDAPDADRLREGSVTVTSRYRHKDGRYIWFECTYRTVPAADGTVESVLSFCRDITERKAAEERMELQTEQYRRLIDHFPDAVLISSRRKGLYMNRACIKLLGGVTGEDERTLLRDPFRFVPLPEPQPNAAAPEAGAVSDEGFREIRLTRLDGRTIEAEARSAAAAFQNEQAVVTIIRDITERKKTMEMLYHSERLSAAGQLAAGIAHEIRNPLTAIRGFHQLIQSNGPKKDYFDIMSAELDRIEMILTELLVLSKPQEVKFQRADIVALLAQVIALLETQAIITGARLLIECEHSALYIRCDANQLKQAFINLIKNAIEAMPDGGDVTIAIVPERSKLVILVTDEGPGIREEEQSRIGQPFYTTKEKGTGLGLMITQRIIENHRGTMKIESVAGEGATFRIEFPFGEEPRSGEDGAGG
ncbi:PAS domain S-box protein [Paenibacillus sp. GYB003]|uniref:PAS domain S-box protein n=1 Tax=Paenibacillus sp. GYB003 TaxID=2994392 RepID=UPI002F963836